ncbi:DNA polymerase III epsilon subunit [hydrothermal vent metagenome]|uniref:DNA polymerase III epsilon subunit n=1 Tax=hydrothermal vent metagenome TaxID=652676 RepID=A0A1W1C0A9_9ZZZZ
MPNSNLPFSKKSISRLSTKGLSYEILKREIDEDDVEGALELLRSQGVELVKKNALYYFSTKFVPIEEAEFCIVDIETNGSKLDKHQIIEIAALKVKNKKIIDRFESLVQCDEINPHITDITGISTHITKGAPKLKKVLEEFRLFLADAVFVAHDVGFDYRFISGSLEQIGLLPLTNRALCSIDLAERTISSYRYGLKYLNDYLHLHPEATHHRAMSDVITTYRLFVKSLENLPKEVKTVEDLIAFSKNGKRLKRPKFDPMASVEESIEVKTTP